MILKINGVVATSTMIGEVANEVREAKGGLEAIGNFLIASKEHSIWYALTGQDFGPWLATQANNLLHFIIDCSDVLVIPEMLFIIGAIAGSGFCKKWSLYTVVAYVLLKGLGLYI
jgi:hypothetical protein